MPHIAITMIPGRDRETMKELALKVQAFICRELNLKSEFVSVSFEDVPKEEPEWQDCNRGRVEVLYGTKEKYMDIRTGDGCYLFELNNMDICSFR